MVDIPKLVRTKSQQLLGVLETVLSLPVTLSQGDTDTGSSLDTARALLRRHSRHTEVEDYEAKFTGNIVGIVSKFTIDIR